MGARGGWDYGKGTKASALQTVNIMEDPLPQESLSQSLHRGTGLAHRQQVHGGPEYRNFRRAEPIRVPATGPYRHPAEQRNDPAKDMGKEPPSKQIGVSFKDQLDAHRRMMLRG